MGTEEKSLYSDSEYEMPLEKSEEERRRHIFQEEWAQAQFKAESNASKKEEIYADFKQSMDKAFIKPPIVKLEHKGEEDFALYEVANLIGTEIDREVDPLADERKKQA